jgi:signal transduction histidine kinase
MSRLTTFLRHLLSGLRWQGLTPQLFLFIVLPATTLLVVIAFGSLTLHGRAMRALVGERDERAARAAAAALAEGLNHRSSAVRGLAIQAARATAINSVLADYAYLLADFDGGLALFTPEGEWLASTGPAKDWSARPLNELLSQISAKSEPRFSAVFADPASGGVMLMVAAVAAADPSATPAPIVVGAFSPTHLARQTLGPEMAPGGLPFILLVDDQGQVLHQQGLLPAEANLGQHPGVDEALRGEGGAMYRTVAGSEHVIAFSPVAPLAWALIVEEPWEAVDNPLLRQTQAAPLVLVPALIVALIALGFGIRQIIQPLRRLEQQANQLAWGRFEAIETPVGGIAEIRHLQAELAHMAKKVKAAQKNLRDYVGAITAGQEDERGRLARELHDGTVQSLVALDQRAQLAQLALKDAPPEVRERLADMRRMTTTLIDEVRRVVRALRPNYLEDLGLLPALEMLARDLQTASGLPAMFTSSGQPRRLSPGQEIAIYRIVQEALTNTARYASARSAKVTVIYTGQEVVVRVQDDGKGFLAPERVSDLVASGHYGLMGMQERAELLGARLDIQSTPGAGTSIEVRLPTT